MIFKGPFLYFLLDGIYLRPLGDEILKFEKKLLGQDLSKIDVLYFHNLQLSRNISDFLLVVKMTYYKSILKKSDQNCHEMWGHQG